MSIISEGIAEQTANKLERIILTAINNRKYGDHRSSVRDFVNNELVEWYYSECDETFGMSKPNPEILKMFPRKK